MQCKICGMILGSITYQHLKEHHITSVEYKQKFPNEKLAWNGGLRKDSDIRMANLSRKLELSPIVGRPGHPNYRSPTYMGQKRYDECEKKRIQKLKIYLKDHSVWLNPIVHAKGVATRKERYDGKYFSKYGLDTIHNHNGNMIRLQNMTPKDKLALGEILAEKRKQWWAKLSAEQKSNMLRNIHTKREPSYPENVFIKLCEENNLNYIYTGAIQKGYIDIGGKIPDFMHINKKLVVEIYGEYYHVESEIPVRMAHFASFGYKCIIFWAKELRDKEMILKRLQEFEVS
jgi:very-short-patch-repair endonuclease